MTRRENELWALRLLVLLALILYTTSFFFPAIAWNQDIHAPGDADTSERVILDGETYTTRTGWQVCYMVVVVAVTSNPLSSFALFFITGMGVVAIWANPLFVYCFFLIATGRSSDALKPGLAAVALAAFAWLATSHLLLGYYLWLASLITLTASAWVGEAMHRRFDQSGTTIAKNEPSGTGSTVGT